MGATVAVLATLQLASAADLRFERHDIAAYPATYQVAVADVNGDGKPDIVVGAGRNNKVLWYENRGPRPQ
jgi:hypothetical protein